MAERLAERDRDELARLREENSSLKKHNLEQGEKVKQLSVQMVRIRTGLQQQAVPKDLPPATKARAAKELSKDNRIAELECTLGQHEAREAKMAQQLSYFKTVAGTHLPGGRPSGIRPGGGQKKVVRASQPQRRVLDRVEAPRAQHPPAPALLPPPAIDGHPASAAIPVGGAEAAEAERSTLMQMLQAAHNSSHRHFLLSCSATISPSARAARPCPRLPAHPPLL